VKSSREREQKLFAPPGFRLPSLGLVDGVVAAPLRKRRLLATYLDTEDLRLVRFGVTLRHRTGEGWTLKLPVGSGGGFLVRNELVFAGSVRRPPDEAVDLVQAYARSRPLAVCARLRTLRGVVELTDSDGTKLGELVDDRVAALDEDRRVLSAFRELELELGEDTPAKVSKRLVRLLESAGAAHVEQRPKLVRALGSGAEAPPDVVVAELGADASAGEVVRNALAAAVTRLIEHDPVVRLDADVEGVHKARVATRTLRSDLRTFAPLLDQGWSDALRSELGWLADLLGRVRDTDVMLAALAERVGSLDEREARAGARVLVSLRAERKRALAELLAALRSERYVALLDRLVAAAASPRLTPEAAGPARELVPPLVRKPWRSLERSVKALGKQPDDRALHDVRIRAKRCRYAAEAAAAVLGKRGEAFARAAADLQQVLGDLNDAVVAEAWLRDWAAGGRRAPGSVFAAGELAALQRAAADDARSTWRKSWKALAAARPRSLA
jgi:CHAD domain-containing protein